MNKEQLKNNEGNFVYLDPLPIKLQGLYFEEWVAAWRIEKVYRRRNILEISNPYFCHNKQLPLDAVKNLDESYKLAKFPYQIEVILKLYAQLCLDGYRVIVEKNKSKWGEWHRQNYLSRKKIFPHQISYFLMSQFLRCYFHREIAI